MFCPATKHNPEGQFSQFAFNLCTHCLRFKLDATNTQCIPPPCTQVWDAGTECIWTATQLKLRLLLLLLLALRWVGPKPSHERQARARGQRRCVGRRGALAIVGEEVGAGRDGAHGHAGAKPAYYTAAYSGAMDAGPRPCPPSTPCPQQPASHCGASAQPAAPGGCGACASVGYATGCSGTHAALPLRI